MLAESVKGGEKLISPPLLLSSDQKHSLIHVVGCVLLDVAAFSLLLLSACCLLACCLPCVSSYLVMLLPGAAVVHWLVLQVHCLVL
jgi:hypothetical protein